VQVCAENFSSPWKFVAYLRETLHVFRDLVKNFAEQVTTLSVSLFIHLCYSVASVFLFLHFPIMFRMTLYSAPLSFFFEILRYLKLRIDHSQIINSFSEKIIFYSQLIVISLRHSQIIYSQYYNVWGGFYIKYIESSLVTIYYIKSLCELLILVCQTTKWWGLSTYDSSFYAYVMCHRYHALSLSTINSLINFLAALCDWKA